ncbi:MAG: hypothetical protein LBH06_08365 [Rikenellaceae bacterium]|jgi:enamine deaminase RidA (YjgF/YER057c/UK114 family)|nr:hypothetical protein [Rikenellaceae bacterium]
MKYSKPTPPDLPVEVRLSAFERENAGEYHLIMEGNDMLLCAEAQYANIEKALKHLTENILPADAVPVLKRWLVSDAVNHETLLKRVNGAAATSVVQQPPLSGAKVALWAWFVQGAQLSRTGENSVAMRRSACRHLFDMQMHSHGRDEFAQTEEIFENYTGRLRAEGCTLADNALRTWIFVQGVDTHYADMVKARKLHFYGQGLTEHTHYIASTGIEGKYIHPETTVLMDAYAVDGLVEGQVAYLKGAGHLNPTHEYGVTFERATAVDYGDRRHIFVSGTASIDNRGNILHPLDIRGQTERTLENVGVLLAEGGARTDDIAQMIVYLRDTADYRTVAALLGARCPDIPKVIVWAPVCRPGWLVEIECIAVCAAENRQYAPF